MNRGSSEAADNVPLSKEAVLGKRTSSHPKICSIISSTELIYHVATGVV